MHLAVADKFIDPYIDMLRNKLDSYQHLFLIRQSDKFVVKPNSNVILVDEQYNYFQACISYVIHLNCAEKIILHGLFDKRLILLLFVQPWLLKKCYWVMWGGDLYYCQIRSRGFWLDQFEKIRRCVIKKIGNLVTYVKGDYLFAQQWYGAEGRYHECLMYSSNTFKELPLPEVEHNKVTLLIGNSADPSNNHDEIFYHLSQIKDHNIKLVCPLSYGDSDYALKVAQTGKKLFGDAFNPILDFIPFNDYLTMLSEIDIAVFAHKRQQGMGNIITLLGLGKKVYLREDVTSCDTFAELGIRVFAIDDLNLTPIDSEVSNKNMQIIRDNFTDAVLVKGWKSIFDAA